MTLQELLGDKVIKGESLEECDVSSLSGEGKVLALYFSAHWCPPCRAFTPQLVNWYKKFKQGPNGDNFDIVFVSSDRTDDSFKEYFKEMPWYALPFSNRDRKGKLSQKFKVSGIPTLVMVNAETGQLISAEGRSIIMEDKQGEGFPWKPKPFLEVIQGKLLGKHDKEVPFENVKDKILGIYFSAHWCGPCRSFTPQLIETYDKLKKENKNFEIIFVSSDREENSWKEYFKTMPWLGLPFEDERVKALSRLFEVSGIPTLVIVDESGKTITTKGRGAVGADCDGKEFPWYPKPVNAITGGTASEINDTPSLIWFTGEDKDATKLALETVKPIAEEMLAKWKDDIEMAFFVAGDEEDDDDIISSLRTFAGLGTAVPLLVIMDIPQQQVFVYDGDTIDANAVQTFIKGYFDKTIDPKPLKP